MSDAGYSMLGAGAWGWPTEMLWGGRWEGGSCLGTPVRIKDFKIKKIKNNKNKKQNKTNSNPMVQNFYPSIPCSYGQVLRVKHVYPHNWESISFLAEAVCKTPSGKAVVLFCINMHKMEATNPLSFTVSTADNVPYPLLTLYRASCTHRETGTLEVVPVLQMKKQIPE